MPEAPLPGGFFEVIAVPAIRTVSALAFAFILGGVPFFAEAAHDPWPHCTGLSSVVKEGTPGLLKIPSAAPQGGTFYVLTASQDDKVRNHTGLWEKNPKAPAHEQNVLRYEPYHCVVFDGDGKVVQRWDQIPADILVMGGTKLTAATQ